MNYLEFLAKLDCWGREEPRLTGVAIVGSYARQNARPESDIDITLLCQQVEDFSQQQDWLSRYFPTATNVREETWGPVHTVRFWLDQLEIELNFSPLFWANVPVDPGTANVVAGGMTIVKDDSGALQLLINAVADGDIVHIRTHETADAEPLAHLFYQAVHAIPESLYSTEQKQAWAPALDAHSVEQWQQRIDATRPFIAQYQDQVAGFIELDTNGHIDCLYVAPRFQGLGIGGQLYQQAVNEARGFGLTTLRVEASHAAKPFFLKRGFKIEQENTVRVRGVDMVNWQMVRTLS